jgi:hypothetical protein
MQRRHYFILKESSLVNILRVVFCQLLIAQKSTNLNRKSSLFNFQKKKEVGESET